MSFLCFKEWRAKRLLPLMRKFGKVAFCDCAFALSLLDSALRGIAVESLESFCDSANFVLSAKDSTFSLRRDSARLGFRAFSKSIGGGIS